MATTSPYGLKTTHMLNDPGLVADINEIAGALNNADGRITNSLQPGNLTVKANRGLAISGAGTSASPLIIDSPLRWSGSGSPYGSLVPTQAGIEYVDTAQTLGARAWRSTGTTSTSWVVIDGDTGDVDITAKLANGWTATWVRLSRINSDVVLSASNLVGSGATSTTFLSTTAFVGFRARSIGTITVPVVWDSTGLVNSLRLTATDLSSPNYATFNNPRIISFTYKTVDSWPTTFTF